MKKSSTPEIMKMRNRLEIEAFRFVNKTGIKNLTVDELIKAVEKMECAVIELDDEKQSVLLGKTDKEDKFYLFNNGTLKKWQEKTDLQ